MYSTYTYMTLHKVVCIHVVDDNLLALFANNNQYIPYTVYVKCSKLLYSGFMI